MLIKVNNNINVNKSSYNEKNASLEGLKYWDNQNSLSKVSK